MAHLNITTPAERDGSAATDGMDLGELTRTLEQARTAGATDATRVKVKANRNGRVREVTVEVRPADSGPPEQPAAEQPPADS